MYDDDDDDPTHDFSEVLFYIAALRQALSEPFQG